MKTVKVKSAFHMGSESDEVALKNAIKAVVKQAKEIEAKDQIIAEQAKEIEALKNGLSDLIRWNCPESEMDDFQEERYKKIMELTK